MVKKNCNFRNESMDLFGTKNVLQEKMSSFLKFLNKTWYEKTLLNSQSNLTTKGFVKKGKV